MNQRFTDFLADPSRFILLNQYFSWWSLSVFPIQEDNFSNAAESELQALKAIHTKKTSTNLHDNSQGLYT